MPFMVPLVYREWPFEWNYEKLGIKFKEILMGNYLELAIKEGLVKLTIFDKSTSKN